MATACDERSSLLAGIVQNAAPVRAFVAHVQPGAGDTAVASDEPFRALFESIDEGVATLEVLFDGNDRAIDYRFLAVNRAYYAVSSMGGEVVGKRISEVMPDMDPSVIQRIGKVAVSGEPSRFEDFIAPLDRWFEVYLSPFGDPRSRTVVAVFRDITKRIQRERLQVFLLTLSDALRPLVDPQAIQVLAADLLGEHLQVNQALYGEVHGEYIHISHSYAKGLVPMIGTFRPEDFGKRLIDGHRAGLLQVCSNTTSDPLFDEQERQALSAAHVGAYIAVPLVKAGVWVAVLSIHNIQPRNWAPTEVEAVQEVAECTWAAVERTRAERALSESEEKYRLLFESQAFLLSLSDSLRPLRDPLEVQRVATAALGLHLGVNRALYFEVQADGDTVRTGPAYLDGVAALPPMLRMSDFGVLAAQYRRNEPSVAHDVLADPLIVPALTDLYAAIEVRAAIGVPLLKNGRVVSIIGVNQAKPRMWTASDVALIQVVAERTWDAVELARTEQALRESEVRLRESDARLRLAVKSSKVGLWDWNVPDQRTYFSPEWKDQLGYGADELSDRFEEWESRVHPDDKTRVLSHIEEHFRESAPAYEDEFRLRHKDGTYRWIYTRAEILRDSAGTPERMAGCHVDITERKRAEEALRHSAVRTRELQRRLTETEENERRTLHRELHDRIGQDLATAKLNIELARTLPSAEIDNRLGMALELLQSAIATSRDIMAELRPPGLDDYGLGVAIRILAGSLEDRFPIAASARDVDYELRLPPRIEAALFRIAQEAVNNLIKYANARTVEISFVQEAQEVRLMIADDGCGFEVSQLPETGGYGLQIMRERAEAVDAVLKVDSSPGRGTRIIAIVEHTA